MTIKWKNHDEKRLVNFLEEVKQKGIEEMAVNFGTKKREWYAETWDDIDELLGSSDININSSSAVGYDNQEKAWTAFAKQHGFNNCFELASAIETLLQTPDVTYGFRGIEGLAAITNNGPLLQISDYFSVGQQDQLMVSFFYGGKRLEQWEKYVAKRHILPHVFVDELKNYIEYNGAEFSIDFINDNKFKVNFDEYGNKTEFYQMLKSADRMFDFSIEEEMDSDTWTVTVSV